MPEVLNIAVAQTPQVNEALGRMNKRTSTPMTEFERRQVENGAKHPIYIYSVNPIHEWNVNQQQLGTVKINKKLPDQIVSTPTTIPGIVARSFDKGFGKRGWLLEEGVDVVEDILGCSEKLPAPTQDNNLTTFGVFFLMKPFEEHSEKQQKKIVEENTAKAIKKLQNQVLAADALFNQGHGNWISQIAIDALAALNELTGNKESRPWAPILVGSPKTECQFCGHMNKSNVALCYNCKNVVNPELMSKLQKGA